LSNIKINTSQLFVQKIAGAYSPGQKSRGAKNVNKLPPVLEIRTPEVYFDAPDTPSLNGVWGGEHNDFQMLRITNQK
jgi:hypothetical protein